MKIFLFLIITLLTTLFAGNVYSQLAADECINATNISVLNNAYTGNTTVYTGADAAWIHGSNQFCGASPNNSTIENNGYFKFTAINSFVTFEICTLAGCSRNGSWLGISGIQALIFHFASGTCGSGSIVKDYCLKQLSGPDCGSCGNPKGCLSEVASVTPGMTYYFMIDGYEGDDCPFSITFTSGVLPIELVDFDVECEDNNVAINWSTISETNNDFFTVEKSMDGISFEAIGTLTGEGNSSSLREYSMIDYQVSGSAFYRLKQTDFDGNHRYSRTTSVECNSGSGVNVFPNPAGNEINISMENNVSDTFSIIIYNSTGELIYNQEDLSTTEIFQLQLSDRFSSGVYMVQLMTEYDVFTNKSLSLDRIILSISIIS